MALQLNQHSWQAEVGALNASDAFWSEQSDGADTRWHDLSESGKEWLVGGSYEEVVDS